jgi:hypothetical protein
MVLAALAVEGLFMLVGWVPTARNATVSASHIKFNYTSILDIVFGPVAVALVLLFARTGGPKMMRMMDGSSQHGRTNHQHG